MKRTCVVLVALTFILGLPLSEARAGTFLVGAKYWQAQWDSAVLDWFEKDIGAGFAEVGVTLVSDVDKGSGYLAGPVLGYQTDDGAWAFSFAPMFLSHFSQDWHGQADTMTLETGIDTTRMDYDLAAIYSLAQYQDRASFLRYCRVYAGYKYQTVEYDLTLRYDTDMGQAVYDYTLDARVHMPTVGFGVVYPIFEKLVFGIQGGMGLALIDLKMTDQEDVTFDIYPKYSVSFNGEANVSLLPIDNLVMQLGYRFQEWYLEAMNPRTWEKTESRDRTTGPTLTVVYTF
ncbi:MAG: hypothetical protein MUD15_00110 [Desulfobacterota bacterium]|jgi:hypothetical protein|nr:hypothetical protein [Thermodesulfobacteriota bacterium]